MTSTLFGSIAQSIFNCACVLLLAILISMISAPFSSAATIGFSGNIVAPAHRALMPERSDITTFTNRVGIRFQSENPSAEPIRLRLSIRDSAGQRIKPVSITGNAVVQPRKQNLITIVLPVLHQGKEVFELCLQQINKSKNVLHRACSKLSVARLN